MIKHKHHIIPKHMGGSDDPSNLVELTIEEHAEAHRKLFEEYGDPYDEIAWRTLSGQITQAEAIKEAQKESQRRRWTSEARAAQSKLYKENNPMKGRKLTSKHKKAISEANSVPKPHLSKLYKGRAFFSASGKNNPKSRAVVVDDIEYESVTAAAKAKGVSTVTARRRLTVDTFPSWKYK